MPVIDYTKRDRSRYCEQKTSTWGGPRRKTRGRAAPWEQCDHYDPTLLRPRAFLPDFGNQRKSGCRDTHDRRNGQHSLPETMTCSRILVADGWTAMKGGLLRMDRGLHGRVDEILRSRRVAKVPGSEWMTFWGTPPFRFLKNERILSRGRLSGRCHVPSSGQNQKTACPNPIEFWLFATSRSITFSSPSDSSSSAPRAGGLVAGTSERRPLVAPRAASLRQCVRR